MRCINNLRTSISESVFRIRSLGVFLAVCLCCCGCGSDFAVPYQDLMNSQAFSVGTVYSDNRNTAVPFADDLAVVSGDITGSGSVNSEGVGAAAIFSLEEKRALYADNVFAQLYPASLTKVMTAIVALENASPDTLLTASANVTNLEAGAQAIGLAAGDTMTLDQAIRILLIYSANDVAVMIAENIGSDVTGFIDMMNRKAASIGATSTNFVNSNGLSDNNHYSTAYDMYLIFREAISIPLFQEVINMNSYSTVYHDSSGNEKTVNVNSTNLYNRGVIAAPSGITVIGGKTGTTYAAGHCLILLAKDTSGRSYISVVMRSPGQEELYSLTNQLLGEIQ